MSTRCTCILVLLAVPSALFAQGSSRDTARTSPIVVTATRSEMARDRVPESVSVLSGEQLRREGIVTVADALRQVPGVALAQSAS